MKAIETEHLTKFYGSARGITDVSLTVDAGDFFGFIGPNGAGKSTTIRTLLGLIRPTSGSAAIFGKPIGAGMNEIRAEIGYLPAEAMFYSGIRVRDILKLSANLRGMNCDAEAKKLCARLELDDSRKVEELSLGNRKKVGIVCAMQHKPRLYIMDEPTSGLDPLMQREFYALLCERNREGATVFLSSHALSEVQRYCQHAAVIREGSLLACDSVDKLGHAAAKRVTLRGTAQIPALDGVRDIRTGEDSVSFLYSGDVQKLVKALSGLPLTDLTVAEPDLEEVFLHYYQKEGAGHDDLEA